MKVLITGGAGYIGSHLTDYFHTNGDTVTVVDNLSTGDIKNIQHNIQSSRYTFVHGSILDRALMEKLIEGHDLICHLAAVVYFHLLTGIAGDKFRHRDSPLCYII